MARGEFRRIPPGSQNRFARRRGHGVWTQVLLAVVVVALTPVSALAQDAQIFRDGSVDVKALLQAGGVVGWVIVALSIAMANSDAVNTIFTNDATPHGVIKV